MFFRMLAISGLCLPLALPAFAQNTQSTGAPTASGSTIEPSSHGSHITTSAQTDQSGTSGIQTSGTAEQQANASDNGAANGNQQQGFAAAQQMRQDLQGLGFTDVKIMPESFLIRAKDKQGRSVMMVVNPDSVLAVTAIGKGGSSDRVASSASGQPKTTVQ